MRRRRNRSAYAVAALIALGFIAGCGAQRGRASDGSRLSVGAQIDDFAQALANNRVATDELADRFDYSPEVNACRRTRPNGAEAITCATRGDFDVQIMRQRWGALSLDRAGSTATTVRLCAAKPIAQAKRSVHLCARFAPINQFIPDAYDDLEGAIRQEGDSQDIHEVELEAR
ncbi:MAG TPA: hypothetical protein VG407_10455 [Caulobacteraceae bacterium]|jgi:hypothetical protein|nr:hypothetical protein [Caulobacteraceae bacterium]